jgi:N-acetylglucosamine-6-phosphate deacetylase
VTIVLAGRLAWRGVEDDGWVAVEDGRVRGVGHGVPPHEPTERVAGLLSPGLVDLQVNGAAGHEVTGEDAALDAIEAGLLEHGVTSWLPTVISAEETVSADTVVRLAARAADPRSTVAGIHLEGPFLSPAHAGMHRAQHLRRPVEGVPVYVRNPAVRIVTLAPELDGALALVAELAAAGVIVSLGHSGAPADTALAAVAAGASMVTHLFNAMGELHHRAPGLPGVALTDERLAVGLIGDGVHVSPRVLAIVARCAAQRVVLTSDASPAAHSPVPVPSFAGVALDAEGRQDGRPAGSLALLDEQVSIWARSSGLGRAAALYAATEAPAELIGLPPLLRPRSPADLVEWTEDGRVARVMRGGVWL